MKVFVTGSSGFIGSHLIRNLLSRGHRVLALAFPDDPLRRLHDITGQFEILRAELSDIETIRRSLRVWQADSCVHLAWYAEPGEYLESPENIPVLTASLQLLRELQEIGCGRVVMAGTCAEYDLHCGYVREDSPTRPETMYAAAKLALGQIGLQFAKAHGLSFAWARIFYLFGPQEDPRRMIPSLILALRDGTVFAASSGDQVRDYLHVGDVANAFATLAETNASGVFNVASGVPITIRSLMQTTASLVGRADLIRFGALPDRTWEPGFICGDNTNLRSLGWTPQYDLHRGLENTCKWWLDNPSG